MTWLQKHDPEINWDNGYVTMTRCPRSCGQHAKEYRRKKAQERLKRRKATKWELWEYVKSREKEVDFLACREGMDFLRSKWEGPYEGVESFAAHTKKRKANKGSRDKRNGPIRIISLPISF
jgi:hypothetical protein